MYRGEHLNATMYHEKTISYDSGVSDEVVLKGAFGGHIATASEAPIRNQSQYLVPNAAAGVLRNGPSDHLDHQRAREMDSAEELEQTSDEYYDVDDSEMYDNPHPEMDAQDVHQTVGPPPAYPPPRGSTIERQQQRRAVQRAEHLVVEMVTRDEFERHRRTRRHEPEDEQWANVQRMLSEDIVVDQHAAGHLDANGHDRTKTVMYEMEHTPDNEDEFECLEEEEEDSEQYGDHQYYDDNTSTSDDHRYDDDY